MSADTSIESTQAIDSPPPSDQSARSSGDDSRVRLHRLANELVRTQNRRLLAEYLTLRRNTR